MSKYRLHVYLWHKFNAIAEKLTRKDDAPIPAVKGISKISDAAYLDDGDDYHKLDIIYSEEKDNPLTPIIYLHGGAWMSGDKTNSELFCRYLAKEGHVVFNVNYRLAPDFRLHDQLTDVNEAMRFISSYRDIAFNKDYVLLFGDSAGGQLACYMAAMKHNEKLRSAFGINDTHTLDIKGCVLISPVCDLRKDRFARWLSAPVIGPMKECTYPEYLTCKAAIGNNSFPPTMLITAVADGMREQVVDFASFLNERGMQYKLLDFEEQQGERPGHIFIVQNPYGKCGQKAMQRVYDFI